MLETRKRDWAERQRKFTEFCIDADCWSGIDHQSLESWLRNFPDEEGEYYALRLLYRFIYYSEVDTAQLCKHGLFNLLLGKEIMADQISSKFNYSSDELNQRLDRELRSSRIVPLLDRDKPYESGPLITRILVQRLQIPESLIINPGDILEHVYKGCKRIIIIDDCVGSGDQITVFWKRKNLPVGNYKTSLEEMAGKYATVDFHYLTLVATESGIKKAEQALPVLKIEVCETLTDEQSVFSANSRFFESQDEKERTIDYLQKLLKDKKISLKGYGGLDYAIAFHHNMPDWSLPLFHKHRSDWRPLVMRKDSDA